MVCSTQDINRAHQARSEHRTITQLRVSFQWSNWNTSQHGWCRRAENPKCLRILSMKPIADNECQSLATFRISTKDHPKEHSHINIVILYLQCTMVKVTTHALKRTTRPPHVPSTTDKCLVCVTGVARLWKQTMLFGCQLLLHQLFLSYWYDPTIFWFEYLGFH